VGRRGRQLGARLHPWQTVYDYGDEAWCGFSCDFVQSNGLTPSGFDYDQMVADINAMQDPN
jgi:hypothetical protein